MFSLVKRNKRFWVERDGEAVYSPPDWLRPHLNGRDGLRRLVVALNSGASYIKAVVEFESGCRPNPRPGLVVAIDLE